MTLERVEHTQLPGSPRFRRDVRDCKQEVLQDGSEVGRESKAYMKS